METIYFIVNTQARNGHCLKTWQSVETELQKHDIKYHAFFTRYRGHAIELASDLAKKNVQRQITLVAVGGDGTMHEVMNGAFPFPNVSIGFIPGGSGNDFSRGFFIPSKPKSALHCLLDSMKDAPKWIDSGKVSSNSKDSKDSKDRYFINNMGVGFDALISYEVNQSRMKKILNKLRMGRMIYVYYLLKKLFTYRCSVLDITIDGKKYTFHDTWFVTVSNQPFYGGGMKIAPTASPCDGILNITIVHELSRLKLLLVFISVFGGKHVGFKEVKSFEGRKIEIQTNEALYVHADGEYIGKTPLEVTIQPSALSVFLKKGESEACEWKERKMNDTR
ncbi:MULTISPECIES: diacylglycerol kinase family protein [unclassified Bacillus (in: firmicutes)]|uniref:diacylglycerol/lipid kinase family protein n=1 Tax=unclassified Bacillus (in: firmicutes) TaxID=185979 RepID=UPI0008E8AFEB|nr:MULTISPECIES: diacylglycerol kinase family protein [unclassified Bacillus (in: firmicutes)]SFB17973.1 lipid kinase, YegS/Rv2252/BmrU family [Bacillus sp. UNCCL13]SFQ76481.1 lipid kinase, YegS/Rv2252/BmrU family [Bacillus sp. cl95]